MATDLEQLQLAIETAYSVLDEMLERLEELSEPEVDELEMSDFIADDSILLHADGKRKYDPKKAHDYYMRTRKLKGRRSGGGNFQVSPNSGSKYTSGEKLWMELTNNQGMVDLHRKYNTSANRKKVQDVFERLTKPQRTVATRALRVPKTVVKTASKAPETVLKSTADAYLGILGSWLSMLSADKASKSVNDARRSIRKAGS